VIIGLVGHLLPKVATRHLSELNFKSHNLPYCSKAVISFCKPWQVGDKSTISSAWRETPSKNITDICTISREFQISYEIVSTYRKQNCGEYSLRRASCGKII